MSEQADPLVIETASRLFRNVSTFETVERAEGERWCEPVWDALVEAGFPWVSIPESAGGSGGSLFDLAAILRAAGAYSAPVPLAETAMLGGWLLGAAGLALPDGAVTVVSDSGSLRLVGGRVSGSAKVAWAQRSDRIENPNAASR